MPRKQATCAGVTWLLLAAVAAGQGTPGSELKLSMHDCGVAREQAIASLAARARDRAAVFFSAMGFTVAKQEIASKAEVFCARDSARKALAAEFHAAESDIPATFSGTVQNGTLFVVSRDIYEENFMRLYGAAGWSEEEYEKLMVHEMIHSGHEIVAKKLFGTAEGMGPQWLFEGMAIEGSGQLPTSDAELSKVTLADFNEFLRKADKDELSPPVYVQYGKFYRYVRRFVSSKWMVENAGKPDVNDRIRAAIQARPH
jgi:hypothetical protein